MADIAGPTEGPRHPALHINPTPDWFVDFFPGPDVKPPTFSWAQHLAVQQSTTSRPAWCRVAVEAHSTSRRHGLIMKRISLPQFRALGPSPSTAVAAPESAEVDEEEARRIRPRLSTFVSTVDDIKMIESPPSQAEIMSSLMKAKVAVANHYYSHVSPISAEENQQLRTDCYLKYVPRKRLLDDNDTSIDRDALTNRNRLRTYSELSNILASAAEVGAAEIDLTTASCAEASAALSQSGRDPRVYLAAQGAPDLSVITDATEPAESPRALPKLLGAMSPVKRLAGQSSPIMTPTKRLTDSLVPLLPSSSPKASPSPTKSSAPSSPVRTPSQAKRRVSSPAGFPRSPVNIRSPSQPREQPGTPTFSSPHGSLIATPSSLRSRRTSGIRDTPTKPRLRAVTTPSRRNALEPASPYQMFSPRAATPSQTESPLGFVASLPDQLKSAASPATPVVLGDVSSIDFGPSSPSFTHASWLKPPVNAAEIQRSRNVSKALRRRSEPLARSLHKAKIRKRSMSPQKTINEGIESPARDPSDSTLPLGHDGDETVIRHDVSDSFLSTKSVAAAEKPAATIKTPVTTPKKARGIIDVDMRKSLDIFALKASPRIDGKPAMEELARIAKERCDGRANVIISQEDDRLVVRFKLPTEYASMFPESQGADESQFSSPPDLPTSARLRRKNDMGASGAQTGQESPVNEGHSSPAPHSSPCKGDRTIGVSDFDFSSPIGNPPLSPSIALRSSATRTAALRAFAAGPEASGSPFADSSCISFPDAIIDNDDTTIPGLHSSSTCIKLDFSDAPRGFSSPAKPGSSPLKHSTSAAVEEPSTAQRATVPSSPDSGNALASTPSHEAAEKSGTVRYKRARLSGSPAPQEQGAGDAVRSIPDADAHAHAIPPKPIDDSPDREFVRDFIKRSKPKTLVPTTTAPTAAKPRLPLEAKSPNAESVQRPKRKLDEADDFESKNDEGVTGKVKASSTVAKGPEPVTTKEKQSIDLAALATATQDASDEETEEDGGKDDEKQSENRGIDPDADELAAEDSMAPMTRRSSRLRGKTSTTAKSSIPTPVKVGRGKGSLGSVRNEQQDLTRQTLANTRRNKGKALSAKRALEKLADEAQGEDQEKPELAETTALKGEKSVVWKEPLVAYGETSGEQEMAEAETKADAKGKRGRGRGTPKTVGRSRGPDTVAEPAVKATAGAPRARSTKAAAASKRAATGTPARITRSRARD